MDIQAVVRQYILEKHLRGEYGEGFEDTTPLISSGIIDSIGVLDLVNFIETRFKIEFMPREIAPHNLETVEQIHLAIQKKLDTKTGVSSNP
ncbi:MAG: acyl carrier protein [Terriglobales bacterium]